MYIKRDIEGEVLNMAGEYTALHIAYPSQSCKTILVRPLLTNLLIIFILIFS